MNVLSLFDGMACGMLAMLGAGIEVDRYVAFEIDKYAVQTASHNFPMIEQRGDVFDADFAEFEGFDFLVGGSPCTYWSIAQKNNRETEASGMGWELFSQYVRALHKAKPRYFVYENNKSMSNAIRESITKAFGFEPICINSALVSAQNRNRLYWVGKREADGTYSKVDIQQPGDREILVKDILDGAYCFNETQSSKSYCVAERGRYKADGSIEQRFEAREDGKTNVLTTVQKDNNVCEPVPCCAITCEWNESGKPIKAVSAADGKVYTVYEVSDGQITIKDKRYPIKLPDGFYIIRKLTVGEAKRLQTVPEWYVLPVSDSQAYKMLGNGWTVDVIVHLLKGCVGE